MANTLLRQHPNLFNAKLNMCQVYNTPDSTVKKLSITVCTCPLRQERYFGLCQSRAPICQRAGAFKKMLRAGAFKNIPRVDALKNTRGRLCLSK